MSDLLDTIAHEVKATITSGYYEHLDSTISAYTSLKKAILDCKTTPVIAEVKTASPSKGIIKPHVDAEKIADAMVKGGAVGLSVLTEPRYFNGSLGNLMKVRQTTKLPILMKDFVLNSIQLDAAVKVGANAVLLIQTLFDRGYCSLNLKEMINEAHLRNLEVLLETHNTEEFNRAIETDADLIGINNRDLGTLKVDLNTTRNILLEKDSGSRIIVSESGINDSKDIHFLKECGVNAFLIGSAIMQAENIQIKVAEFVNA